MTVITLVTDPLLSRAKDAVPKILDAIGINRINNFTKEMGITGALHSEWLKAFVGNSLYVVKMNNFGELEGFITARDTQEACLDKCVNKEPLIVTQFCLHPRDEFDEISMMEMLIEAAVLLGYKQLKTPNETELMRDFTDRVMMHESFRGIKVLKSEDEGYDLFDLSEFKTIAMLEAEQKISQSA
ncbi:hypothetical protein [Thiomicrorhabdus aquaedulcis]|uniref:hypothetical protein n=1 Tax=Thiomicrorhabdus aquaedulcis TaxID=2211106 RepID=UPI000FDBE874|nr:hypothetical protein [Thiomicrorhabdus aquaedulcis]